MLAPERRPGPPGWAALPTTVRCGKDRDKAAGGKAPPEMRAPGMRVRIEKSATYTTVYASGGIDAVTCALLEKSLVDLVEAGETRIVLDLAQTVHISSAGLRVILSVAKQLHGCGQFVISAADGNVGDILKLAGIADVIDVYPATASAWEAISRSWAGG